MKGNGPHPIGVRSVLHLGPGAAFDFSDSKAPPALVQFGLLCYDILVKVSKLEE